MLNRTLKRSSGQAVWGGGQHGHRLGEAFVRQLRFMRSTDGGASWNGVPGVLETCAFGFGRSRTDYSMIFIGGWVHNEYGIW
jgi:hypothetical protein